MGTDIRFYVEFREPYSTNWTGLAEFDPPRDNDLVVEFGRLIEGRGLPIDFSISFSERAFIYIAREWEVAQCIGQKYCTEELAKRWVNDFGSQIRRSERSDASWVLDPEFKHAGWLTLAEFEGIFLENSEPRNPAIEYEVMYGAMKAVEVRLGPGSVRAIVWSC
jgi:hypothetical protein